MRAASRFNRNADPRTHTARINDPIETEAPQAAPQPADRGPQKAHRMLSKGTHDGVLYHPGQTVMLYDDEIGPHHALIKPEHELARPGLSAAPAAAPAKPARKPRASKPAA